MSLIQESKKQAEIDEQIALKMSLKEKELKQQKFEQKEKQDLYMNIDKTKKNILEEIFGSTKFCTKKRFLRKHSYKLGSKKVVNSGQLCLKAMVAYKDVKSFNILKYYKDEFVKLIEKIQKILNTSISINSGYITECVNFDDDYGDDYADFPVIDIIIDVD